MLVLVLWGFGVPFMVLYTFLAAIAVAHSRSRCVASLGDLRVWTLPRQGGAKQGESRA